ncbi:MAG: hypothetical protein WCE29_04125, partial [Mycobacterium sp.]
MKGIVNLLAHDTTNHTKPLTVEETERLTHRGLRLAQFTVAYNLVEGVIAPTAGILGRVGPVRRVRGRLGHRIGLRGAGRHSARRAASAWPRR